MPANQKYLSSSGQRFLKISAGILGGFLVMTFFHNAIGSLLEEKTGLIITTTYTSFIMWALLMVIAFLFKNGWKVWGIYLLLTAVFGAIIFLNK
ncbi:hypothetical protein [Sinomicrobium soli]|uniref:hypothetical protein n=1 Tax=Sinomicrobium sp. N-1-3-6 TaxID=2219864 RepID=UPI000DCB8D23|nr:hypothetical protein [Sinomicrobium sp. N-1-3-6]RAV30324.1 hypothetical protein DN748_02085 [Sinomicrobium sp. N-1-3-6]